MVGEVGVRAGNRLAVLQLFGLEAIAIGSEDELRLGLSCRWASSQRGKGLRHRAGRGDGDVNVVSLENAAGQIRCVSRSRAQPLDRSVLVPEGGEELEREIRCVEGLFRKLGNGFLDLNSVHA